MSAPIIAKEAQIGEGNTELAGAQSWSVDQGRMHFAEPKEGVYDVSHTLVYEAAFVEQTGDGAASTYTATVVVPAGYSVADIMAGSTVVWNATTAAVMDIGDADAAQGYAAAVDLKTSPVANTAGGYGLRILDLNGTYKYGKYYAAAGLITIKITTNDNGTHHAGRTRVAVILTRAARTVQAPVYVA